MKRPKIIIRKKVVYDDKHFRFVGVNNLGKKGKDKEKSLVLDLSNEPSNYSCISYIQTEKQLCRFIFESWGVGEYMIMAVVKGRRGIWVFWRGEINEDGFISERKTSNTREINRLKKELNASESEEERQNILDEIELENDLSSFSKTGFSGFIIPSIRKGEFMLWQDPEPIKESQVQEAVW